MHALRRPHRPARPRQPPPSTPSPPASRRTPAASVDRPRPPMRLPAARRAGSADTRRRALRHRRHRGADRCYLSDGLPTLLRIPADTGDGDTVAPRLPRHPLQRPPRPSTATPRSPFNSSAPARISSGTSPRRDVRPVGHRHTGATARAASSTSSLPAGSGAPLQLAFAAVLAALWRARRLGPLVHRTTPRRRSAPPRPPKAAPASTARPTPATAPPPLFAPPPAPASPLSSASPPPTPTRPTPSCPPSPPTCRRRPQDLHALLFGPAPADDAALIAPRRPTRRPRKRGTPS